MSSQKLAVREPATLGKQVNSLAAVFIDHCQLPGVQFEAKLVENLNRVEFFALVHQSDLGPALLDNIARESLLDGLVQHHDGTYSAFAFAGVPPRVRVARPRKSGVVEDRREPGVGLCALEQGARTVQKIL